MVFGSEEEFTLFASYTTDFIPTTKTLSLGDGLLSHTQRMHYHRRKWA